MNGRLNAEQIAVLLRPIKPGRVMIANGQSHLPAYDVAAHLTRVFGFGGWDTDNCVTTLCFEDGGDDGKRWTVGYSATIRLIIKDEFGHEVSHYENGAGGDAVNQPSRGDAHHLAMTSAISTALKRCAAFGLGDQFGLSLYNRGDVSPLVGKTLVGADGPIALTPADLESHIRAPESLGNDERETTEWDHEDAPRGPQKASGSPKPGHPTPDEERIVEAAKLAPDNSFLQSLAEGFAKHGSLTANQVTKGLEAAGRVLDQPRVSSVPDGPPPWDDEPFFDEPR